MNKHKTESNNKHRRSLSTVILVCGLVATGLAGSASTSYELTGGGRLVPSNVKIVSSDVNGETHYIFHIPNASSCFAQHFFGLNTRVFNGLSDFNLTFTRGISTCSPTSITEDFEVDLGPLPAGEYSLELLEIKGALGLPVLGFANYQLTILITTAFHESPAVGSIQSGVGTIRGWVCDADTITFSVDGEPPIQVPYKGDRGDTQAVCGDTDNGYAIAMNWARYASGQHEFAVFAHSENATRKIGGGIFQTRKIDNNQEFIKGLSAEYTLSDFPSAGKKTLLRWSEADQNFIIIEVTDTQ